MQAPVAWNLRGVLYDYWIRKGIALRYCIAPRWGYRMSPRWVYPPPNVIPCRVQAPVAWNLRGVLYDYWIRKGIALRYCIAPRWGYRISPRWGYRMSPRWG